MEEEIIFLDRFDEVASVKTKLEGVRSDQAAIVVPIENRALRSPIAVRLVVRQAESLALKLGLISGDATVRRLFHNEGIPAFRTVKGYRDYVARQSRPLTRLSALAQSLRERTDRTVGLVVLAALVVLGIAMAYALIPVEKVVLVPVSEPVSDVIVVKADPTTKTVNYDARQIPARVINLPMESSIQVPVTGKKAMPNARAEGQVTLTNRTAGPVKVPAGTILYTPDNIKFVISQETTVPGPTGAGAKVDVVAVDPGDKGNVDRGKISKIEGALDQQLAAFNEEPTTGGGAVEASVVSAQDKERARASLIDKMSKEAFPKLDSQRAENESLPPHSITFTVLEEVYDKKEGDQAKMLNLKISGRARGTIFSGPDVNTLVDRVWQPKTRAGFSVPPKGYKILPPEIIKAEDGAITFVVRVEGVAVAEMNLDRIRENVRWKTEPEAKAYLARNLSLAKEPKVTIEPGWASRALRVHIVVEGDWLKDKKE